MIWWSGGRKGVAVFVGCGGTPGRIGGFGVVTIHAADGVGDMLVGVEGEACTGGMGETLSVSGAGCSLNVGG